VSAILADMPLRLADFLTLKPGDILDTGKPAKGEIEFSIENLLLSLPRRQNLILGDVGPCRLPMTGRREPRLVRGQNVWAVLVGRRCRRKQAKQDNAGCSDHGKSG